MSPEDAPPNSNTSRDGTKAFQKLLFQGTLATDPEKRIQLASDPTTGTIVPKMMYHAHRTQTEDGATSVQITLDASDIEQVRTIVQRERRRAGLDRMPESEIQALFATIRQNIHTIDKPEVMYNRKRPLGPTFKGAGEWGTV